MGTLLAAVNDYAAKHEGQYPESFDHLTASGELKTTNFAGNLGLDDFELVKDGTLTPGSGPGSGQAVILRTIPKSGKQWVIVTGQIDDKGVPSTAIWGVSSE
jgi:hypothetical protein